jgi:hypothetical protein
VGQFTAQHVGAKNVAAKELARRKRIDSAAHVRPVHPCRVILCIRRIKTVQHPVLFPRNSLSKSWNRGGFLRVRRIRKPPLYPAELRGLLGFLHCGRLLVSALSRVRLKVISTGGFADGRALQFRRGDTPLTFAPPLRPVDKKRRQACTSPRAKQQFRCRKAKRRNDAK